MENKAKILSGAKELFYKFGIRSITMDEIAKHLGMSKKTIYQEFKDKDEIVHELMLSEIKQDECDFEKIFNQADNVVDEVFRMMQKMAEVIGNMNPLLFHDLQKYYPETWKMFQKFKVEFILNHVERSIEKGKSQKLVRQDVNTKILSRLRIEEIEMVFTGVVFPHDKFNILESQLALTEHFLYGICTLKGHKLINKYKEINEDE